METIILLEVISNSVYDSYCIFDSVFDSGEFHGWQVFEEQMFWNGKKFLLPLFVLICVTGFWAFWVSELDLFLKSLFFCFCGVSSSSLLRNKAIKDWFLGFFFGAVLIMSFRLGKEDVKFWVDKFRTCSPVAQIALRNRNRKWRVSKWEHGYLVFFNTIVWFNSIAVKRLLCVIVDSCILHCWFM